MSQRQTIRAHNEWTSEQRLVLHLLHSQFNFDAEDRAAAFNHIFDDYLKAQGITDGLKARVLDSQYGERKRTGRSHLWGSVLAPPKSDEETARHHDLLERVRIAAAAVGADLKDTDSTSEARAPAVISNAINQEALAQGWPKTWKGWAEPTGEDVDRLAAVRRQNGFDSNVPMLQNRSDRSEPKATTGGDFPNDVAFGGTANAGDSSVESSQATDRNDSSNIQDGAGQTAGEEGEDGEDEHKNQRKGSVEDEGEESEDEKPTQLDMLHLKDITWSGDEPSWGWYADLLIDHDSDIYKHGGQVHRVYDSEGHVDIMLCDPTFCETCSANADPNSESKTNGLPFVHASDTMRDTDGRMIFKPTPKVNNGNIPQCFWRNIFFHSIDGGLTCKTMVCNYTRCRVCSGSEYIRTKENKDLDKAEREVRKSGAESNVEKAGDRQASEGSSSMFIFGS